MIDHKLDFTNGAYTMMAKPTRALELHYPMNQFLITYDSYRNEAQVGWSVAREEEIFFFSLLCFLFLQIVKLLDSLDATLGLSKSNAYCW